MNHARLDASDRLQRTLRALRVHKELSTMDPSRAAGIVAVSAAISELRANGFDVRSRQVNRVWFYRLVEE